MSKSLLFVPGLGPGGNQESQSPTNMDGWNRIMNNIQAQPNRNQPQQQFNQQQQQNSNRMQPNQFNNQQQQNMNSRPGGQWQQTMNMVRTNNSSGFNNMSGYNNSFDNYNEQSMTYPSNFPNQTLNYQQQPMDQMQSQQLQPQQTPLVVQQQPQQPFLQSLPQQQQQSMQYGPGPGPGMLPQQSQQPVQYMTAAGQPGTMSVQGVQPGPPLVVQQQPPAPVMAAQPSQHAGILSNPTVVNPNQILYQSSTQQNSYMQPAQIQQQQAPMVISATPAPGGAAPVVLTQPAPPMQLVAANSQPNQPLVVQYSSQEPMVAPTPALISAPTPAPASILVNHTALPVQHPPVPSSSNSYSFDPSGLTPAQQLAYAQAQQQHQQQHLKKMRQRLPHVSGRELQNLHRQIKDLQHKQHMQTLQTLRLAQVQEKQAFNYLDSAFKTRQKPNTYHRVNFQLKVYFLYI